MFKKMMPNEILSKIEEAEELGAQIEIITETKGEMEELMDALEAEKLSKKMREIFPPVLTATLVGFCYGALIGGLSGHYSKMKEIEKLPAGDEHINDSYFASVATGIAIGAVVGAAGGFTGAYYFIQGAK